MNKRSLETNDNLRPAIEVNGFQPIAGFFPLFFLDRLFPFIYSRLNPESGTYHLDTRAEETRHLCFGLGKHQHSTQIELS